MGEKDLASCIHNLSTRWSTWSALCPTHSTTEEKSLQYQMSGTLTNY